MIGPIPKRPEGTSARSKFVQWLYDMKLSTNRRQQVSGTITKRSTRGTTAALK